MYGRTKFSTTALVDLLLATTSTAKFYANAYILNLVVVRGTKFSMVVSTKVAYCSSWIIWFFVLINTCQSAFQKGKEKRRKKKREVEETAANCVEF